MAATSPREDAIIDFLRRQFGHVSAERVVSGSGELCGRLGDEVDQAAW